jgi:hypothetical protein
VFADFPNVEPITVPTDLASGADSAASLAAADTTPVNVLSGATTTFTDANQVLTALPMVGDA